MSPLRLRMIEDMRIRNLSQGTQTTYVEGGVLFGRLIDKSPEILGQAEIRSTATFRREFDSYFATLSLTRSSSRSSSIPNGSR
jgi:hypothetical protein